MVNLLGLMDVTPLLFADDQVTNSERSAVIDLEPYWHYIDLFPSAKSTAPMEIHCERRSMGQNDEN